MGFHVQKNIEPKLNLGMVTYIGPGKRYGSGHHGIMDLTGRIASSWQLLNAVQMHSAQLCYTPRFNTHHVAMPLEELVVLQKKASALMCQEQIGEENKTCRNRPEALRCPEQKRMPGYTIICRSWDGLKSGRVRGRTTCGFDCWRLAINALNRLHLQVQKDATVILSGDGNRLEAEVKNPWRIPYL